MSEHVFEHLSAYLDGALGAAEQERFRAHLAECAECASRLRQLADIDDAVRALPDGAPEGYFDQLPSRIRGRLPASRRQPRSLAPLPRWTLAAAAALLLAVLAPLTLRQGPAPVAGVSGRLSDQAASPQAVREVDTFARGYRGAAPPAPATLPAASAAPVEGFRARDEAKTRALRPKLKEPPARATAAPAAAPPPPAAAATAPGFAEPPRATAQVAPQSGPRQSQQAEARQHAPMKKSAETPAELGEAADRDAVQRTQTKDAPASPERARAKSDVQNGAGRLSGLAAAAAARPSPSTRFRELLASAPRSAAAARTLREAWRRFAAEAADAGEADEARVRVIETGLLAFRLERRPEDRSLAERDAAAYLDRDDARQAARVRGLLAPPGR